jgi:hypothetical protein
MAEYEFHLARTLGSFDEDLLIMIEAVLTNVDERFRERELPYRAVAADGVNSVESFMAYITANGKELIAFFTTDAFSAFAGPFDIEFSYPGESIHTVTGIDIATMLSPLDPEINPADFPNADNAWLASQ